MRNDCQAGNNCAQKKNLDDINEFFRKKSGKAACTNYGAFEIEVRISQTAFFCKSWEACSLPRITQICD